MEELLKKVAEIRGLPASMIERSAAARAKAEGITVEAVLREWAGEEAAPAGEPDAAAAEAPEPGDADAVEASGGGDEADEPEEPGPKVEVLAPEGADEAGDAASETEPVEPVEPEPVGPQGAPALSGFPRWLAAAFLVIPAIAVVYALLAPDGPGCGVAGQLDVDPATGEAVNCDGSQWGEEQVDFFTLGEELYVARCASCHGATGGGGVGPGFSGGSVLVTFPAGSCAADDGHIAWVSVGSTGWPDPTYGATAKPVGGVGVMPPFGEALTEEELAAVVLYERVAFGGEELAEAESDCGLIEEPVTAAG
jgi:Cytochrome C oxidase, cbb3-type, subunit III